MEKKKGFSNNLFYRAYLLGEKKLEKLVNIKCYKSFLMYEYTILFILYDDKINN
jgi:hypothetical protein